MKTERITVLGSPAFKTFLHQEAVKEGLSVSELVRRRCECEPGDDERLLGQLADELRRSVAKAEASLREGLAAVHEVLAQRAAHPAKDAA